MREPLRPPEFTSWRLSDGYLLRGRLWQPAAPPRAVILYLHGIQSHGGWFEWSASVLAEAGAAVLLPDRRGSGLNEAARGDTPSAERWLADLDELAAWLADRYGSVPLGVVGISWGGKLALAWAARGARLARMLLVAPGVVPQVDVTFSTKLRIAAALLTRPATRFEIPLSDPRLFSDRSAAQGFIRTDRVKLERATARFLWHSRRLDRFLSRAAPGSVRCPVTLALMGVDRIINNQATESRIEGLLSQPLVVERFQAAAHTLEFEEPVTAYEALLCRWLAESTSDTGAINSSVAAS